MIRDLNPGRAGVYAPLVLDQTPALLSLLDREADSVSFGSFDREHWAWKFRDFPLGMLQSALYPLALLWRYPLPDNPYFENDQILSWIIGGIEETVSRQHKNGAFDAFSPNEQDPGPTMGITHGLTEAFELIRPGTTPPFENRVTNSIRAAATFSLTRNEQHAFVSNHWALIANAFHGVGELLSDERFARRAETLVGRIEEMQSSEGWYHEYGGPDPGYESLGIFHLAMLWRRTGSPGLLVSLRKSVECYAHFVHPDGSVGGCYGARNTSLYFPGGFEILSAEIPLAASIASFMAGHLKHANVVTPATTDAENLPSLAYTYLESCFAPELETVGLANLPHEALRGVREFPDAGITVGGTETAYLVVNGKKGGVCRVFDRGKRRLGYEDAGYVLRKGQKMWVTQRLGAGRGVHINEATWRIEATFQEIRQVQVTSWSFVVLRILNLTLFRSLTLGQWIRNMIVGRLITRKRPGPFKLVREMTVHPDRIDFNDRVERTGNVEVDTARLPRSFNTIHMGSAKYFHPSDLESTPTIPLDGMVEKLNREGSASIRFSVPFDPSIGHPET